MGLKGITGSRLYGEIVVEQQRRLWDVCTEWAARRCEESLTTGSVQHQHRTLILFPQAANVP